MSRHELRDDGYLRHLAGNLRHVPASYKVDGADVDRLREIADRLEPKPENQTPPINQIIITQNGGGSFDIQVGDKSCRRATFDEMLGLVTSLTMPLERPCLRWLKTDSEQGAEGDNAPW